MIQQEKMLSAGGRPSCGPFPDSLVVGWMVIVSGVDCGKFFPLTYGKASMGTAESNTLVISEEYEGVAEESHCSISLTKDDRLFKLNVCGEENFPVFVNGERVAGSFILLGREEIRLGDLKLVFVALCDENFFWPEKMIPGGETESAGELERRDWEELGEIPISSISWDMQRCAGDVSERECLSDEQRFSCFLQKNWLFMCSDSMLGDRKEQQDSSGYWNNEEWAFFVIVDGAGGHSLGAEASRAVIKTASRYWKASVGMPTPEPRLWLESFFLCANEKVRVETYRGGRASVTSVLLHRSGRCYIGHVGDCRAYHLRGSKICFRSKDDNVAQLLVDQGLLSADEVNGNRSRHQLIKALGGSIPPKMGYRELEYERGDLFFLCTDGVWGVLDDFLIAASLSDASSPMYWKGPDCEMRQREHLASSVQSLFHSVRFLSSCHADNASCTVVSVSPVSEDGAEGPDRRFFD